MTKKELRTQIRRRNLEMSPEARRAASECIFRRLEWLDAFGRARCVALYCALPDEPATQVALARWSASKRIVVPRVEGERMRFFDYNAATLCTGAFGIAEPGPAARSCDPSEIDLIVVPGVAFTFAGARMGRGKGYYDRYLAQPEFRALKVGVGYAHQIMESLPVEAHDVAMDRVCTEEE